MSTGETPTVHAVTRRHGVAGQFELTATVEYPGEGKSCVSFVGSTYGGPVVMVTPMGQTYVSRETMERCGSELNEAWVRNFFGVTP